MSKNNFNSLASSMCTCVGTKVVLTKYYLQVSLSNGSTRIVIELFYDKTKSVSGISKLIFTNFSTEYAGNSFFPINDSRKGSFPIYPLLNKYYTINRRGLNEYTEKLRTMLLSKLCCA